MRGNLGNNIEGLVAIDAQLAGAGRSPAEIAASLDGHVQLLMGEVRANVRGLEAMIGGIGTALGTLFNAGGDDWSVVNCSALRFAVRDGIANGEVILFNSRFATVGGEGTVDLGTERLDLLITPKSKAAVTLNISAPVRIQGTFLNPSFTPDTLSVARRILGVAGIFVFPPAALAGLVSLGATGNACIDLTRADAGGTRPAANAPAAPANAPEQPRRPHRSGGRWRTSTRAFATCSAARPTETGASCVGLSTGQAWPVQEIHSASRATPAKISWPSGGDRWTPAPAVSY